MRYLHEQLKAEIFKCDAAAVEIQAAARLHQIPLSKAEMSEAIAAFRGVSQFIDLSETTTKLMPLIIDLSVPYLDFDEDYLPACKNSMVRSLTQSNLMQIAMAIPKQKIWAKVLVESLNFRAKIHVEAALEIGRALNDNVSDCCICSMKFRDSPAYEMI